MTLDSAGLDALIADVEGASNESFRRDWLLLRLRYARSLAAAAPPTGENPDGPMTEALWKYAQNEWGWGADDYEACRDAITAVVVAGRAAATETIPREDALQALHEMSTVAGLLRVRRDDPAVVALGDRLRLACRALRDVTAPGMNELMDSQPGRAAATPDPLTFDSLARAALLPAASPDERLREAEAALEVAAQLMRDIPDAAICEGGWHNRAFGWLAAHDRRLAAADREKPGYYDHDHAADAPPVPDPETNT